MVWLRHFRCICMSSWSSDGEWNGDRLSFGGWLWFRWSRRCCLWRWWISLVRLRSICALFCPLHARRQWIKVLTQVRFFVLESPVFEVFKNLKKTWSLDKSGTQGWEREREREIWKACKEVEEGGRKNFSLSSDLRQLYLAWNVYVNGNECKCCSLLHVWQGEIRRSFCTPNVSPHLYEATSSFLYDVFSTIDESDWGETFWSEEAFNGWCVGSWLVTYFFLGKHNFRHNIFRMHVVCWTFHDF